ncbi:MAG: hypothetical protein JWR26_2130, partial [Pedosphaera sp.]|nr:hypothetical protein [Pedosphaera sp.]
MNVNYSSYAGCLRTATMGAGKTGVLADGHRGNRSFDRMVFAHGQWETGREQFNHRDHKDHKETGMKTEPLTARRRSRRAMAWRFAEGKEFQQSGGTCARAPWRGALYFMAGGNEVLAHGHQGKFNHRPRVRYREREDRRERGGVSTQRASARAVQDIVWPFGGKGKRKRSFWVLASFRLSHRPLRACSFAKASPKPKNPRSDRPNYVLKRSIGTLGHVKALKGTIKHVNKKFSSGASWPEEGLTTFLPQAGPRSAGNPSVAAG